MSAPTNATTNPANGSTVHQDVGADSTDPAQDIPVWALTPENQESGNQTTDQQGSHDESSEGLPGDLDTGEADSDSPVGGSSKPRGIRSKPRDERLVAYRVMLQNALADDEVLGRLDAIRFKEASIRALLENLEDLAQDQGTHTARRAHSQVATQEFHDAWHEARTVYMSYLGVCNGLWPKKKARNTPYRNMLSLNGERAEGFAGFVLQAGNFYDTIMAYPKVKARINRFGIDDESLLEGEALIVKAVNEMAARVIDISDGHDDTMTREEAWDEFDGEMSAFQSVVRLATRDRPKLAEKLGIPTRRGGGVRPSPNSDLTTNSDETSDQTANEDDDEIEETSFQEE